MSPLNLELVHDNNNKTDHSPRHYETGKRIKNAPILSTQANEVDET